MLCVYPLAVVACLPLSFTVTSHLSCKHLAWLCYQGQVRNSSFLTRLSVRRGCHLLISAAASVKGWTGAESLPAECSALSCSLSCCSPRVLRWKQIRAGLAAAQLSTCLCSLWSLCAHDEAQFYLLLLWRGLRKAPLEIKGLKKHWDVLWWL